MRKRLLSWLSTLLILTGTLLPPVSATAERADVIPAGSWALSSSGPVYANGNTTWEYSFARKGNPQMMQQLELALCRSFNARNVNASHGGSVQSSLGPRLIKWETSAMGDGDTITVTYEGLWASGSQSWSIATERDIFKGQVSGPACEVLAPDFTLSKTVSPVADASQAKTSLTLTGGGTVYYFYTVTNTGNVELTIAEAVDDKLGPITFSPAVLPVGGTATAMLSKTFGPGEAALHWHDLRHTAAVFFFEAGLSAPDVQAILGHSSLLVTQLYADTRRLAARRAVPAMSQFFNSQSRGQLEGGESAAKTVSDLVI